MGPRASLVGCENSPPLPPEILSPDYPVRSKSLYLLSYPGPHIYACLIPLVDVELAELFVISSAVKKEMGLPLHQDNSLVFRKTDGTYLFSQQPTICPFPEPVEDIPQPRTL